MKRCLHCNKELILPKTNNNYLKSNFRLKKFCNDRCRIDFHNKFKKEEYITQETEHEIKLKELNKILSGNIVSLTRKRNAYNPDIIKKEIDYELEIFRKMHHLKEKARKWDSTRKHILIITLSDQTRDLFDEVYFFDPTVGLIKEKTNA
ncbi:MAG: hypothetical protein JSW08_03310 [archaeon]|nr:MAG: hypothetical protein JSW08_03310 [archaeon]